MRCCSQEQAPHPAAPTHEQHPVAQHGGVVLRQRGQPQPLMVHLRM
jgi:hypothetical protein